jgi:ATP phosphoribosyltransferase regulatory subunit
VPDEPRRQRIISYILEHDYVAVEAESDGASPILSDLTRWMGGLDMLKEAETLAPHLLSAAALRHLEAVYGHLRERGLSRHVLFDLSMTGHFDYYTGVVFRGYARGCGYAVAEGGRYDNLLAEYGCPAPAVGAGIKLDGVLDALAEAAVC